LRLDSFAKLLGIHLGAGGLSFSVSNRQVVHFGTAIDDWVTNRLNIAMALFNWDAGDTITQLQAQIAELEDAKTAGQFCFNQVTNWSPAMRLRPFGWTSVRLAQAGQ
jgi:hypothetical protein